MKKVSIHSTNVRWKMENMNMPAKRAIFEECEMVIRHFGGIDSWKCLDKLRKAHPEWMSLTYSID